MFERRWNQFGIVVLASFVIAYSVVPGAHSVPSGRSPEGTSSSVTTRIDPTPTPTPTPEAPQPTATPTPNSDGCPHYSMEFDHVVSPFRKTGRTWMNQSNAQQLTCFTELYRTIVPHHNPATTSESWAWVTHELWIKLLEKVGSHPGVGNTAVYEANKRFIHCTGGWQSPRSDGHNATSMIGGGQVAGNKGRNQPGCQTGKLYVNKNCELQPIASVNQSLGSCVMTLKSEVATPISLVWSEAYKGESSTIVNFKLDPTSPHSTWMWRASEALPLLVYDPEHTGVISSGEQLFGARAFGGKAADAKDGAKIAWRDGYEALGSLDRNSDGAISGAELDSISVWFDRNRDAISQKGEVQRVADLSITALYFNADTTQDGVPFATKGYERDINGARVTGSSLDWSERSVTSKAALATGGIEDSRTSSVSSQPIAEGAAVQPTALDESIVGKWLWTIDGPEGSTGYLAFSRGETGLAGVTLSTLGIRGLVGVQAEILFSHFVPTVYTDQSRSTKVSFTTKGASGALLRNSAQLSEDGETLIGKTVVESSQLAKSGSYEYTWRARKVS